MHCFTHHDQEAVGICRACGKGLCADCAVDLKHSISCRGACEQVAQEIHAQIIRSKVIQTEERKRLYLWLSTTWILMGIVCVMCGLMYPMLLGFAGFMYSVTYIGMGLPYLIFGLVLLWFRRRLLKSFNRNTL